MSDTLRYQLSIRPACQPQWWVWRFGAAQVGEVVRAMGIRAADPQTPIHWHDAALANHLLQTGREHAISGRWSLAEGRVELIICERALR